MEINTEYLNQNYEKIWETSTKNGVPVPYLLKDNVDKEILRNTDTDIAKLKLSDNIKDKLNEAYLDRRKKETEIYRENNGVRKRQELIDEYVEDELIEFLKKFPQFKDVCIQK